MCDVDAFRQFERDTQNRGAASYVDFFQPVTAAVSDELLDAAGVKAGTRVLDVACGPGGMAARAAARGAVVTGTDLASEMLAHARRRHPNIEFTEADAEELPSQNESFDAVICSFGIGHFPRPEVAVRELARVTRTNGHVAMSWWAFPDAKVNGTFFEAIAESGIVTPDTVPAGPPVTRYADPSNLDALLRGAGLADVAVRRKAWTVRLPDVDAWWGGGLTSLVRAAVTILAQPADQQHRVRQTFERLAERFRVNDGFDVPMAAWIASGRKGART